MNKIILTVSTLALTMTTGLASAECTRDMDAEMLAECITIEGSGANYQDWRASYEKRLLESGTTRSQGLRASRSVDVGAGQTRVE